MEHCTSKGVILSLGHCSNTVQTNMSANQFTQNFTLCPHIRTQLELKCIELLASKTDLPAKELPKEEDDHDDNDDDEASTNDFGG